MRRRGFAQSNMTPKLRETLERIGAIPPDTAFNRRAAEYARVASELAKKAAEYRRKKQKGNVRA